MDEIVIRNARMHNLKGIDVRIPRNSLTVVTGLSGSGKSSLAFDTLYAEGQRRYVESLSAYARQFLDRLAKPDVGKIEGLSPAISIEQKTTSLNPRSIVATVTEIHDYMRILFASLATPHCPACGREVTRQSAEQIVETLLKRREGRTLLFAPVVKGKKGTHEEVFASLRKKGFSRVRVDGKVCSLEEVPALERRKAHSIDVVVDRLVLPCDKTRLTDSVELALKTGQGVLSVDAPEGGAAETFSELNACLACGLSFDDLKPRSFSFNSPFGACPTCSGLGRLYFFDEDLVIPDKTKPLRECIHPWRRAGHNAIMYYNALLEEIARQNRVSLDTPYEKLPAAFRHGLLNGFKKDLVLPWRSVDRPFEGVMAVLKKRLEEAEDDETRAKYEAYQSERVCPTCHGGRLNAFSLAARLDGKSIAEVMDLPVGEAYAFFERLMKAANKNDLSDARDESDLRPHSTATASSLSCPSRLSGHPSLAHPSHPSCPSGPSSQLALAPLALSRLAALRDILGEVLKRLQFLLDVGLDYLTLSRPSATLSGGEMQRIRLATQIGSGLTGVLYVLDEPTIGLHPRDNERLIATLKELRDRGNTVVVVEHDEEMMRAADWIIDLGPGAGREGGELMYQGPFEGLLKANSLTADYLTGRKRVCGSADASDLRAKSDLRANSTAPASSPSCPSSPSGQPSLAHPSSPSRLSGLSRSFARAPALTLIGATGHNLKNVSVHIPVGAFAVVTGVSGSGKSTLVDETLKRALMKRFYGAKAAPEPYRKITGAELFDKVIEIDQSPIGRTPRSNPATYVGFFSEIRELFAKTEAARARGYTAGRFSFNVKGGRCEVCGGDGVQKLEMSFLPDVYVTCEQCGGTRYNAETLEVRYGGKSIADVLGMTVSEARRFFAKVPSLARKMQTLEEVGLGYIGLGQAATTLSGGEAQRIKLATELSRRSTGKTLYLLDEPTTGLHFDDVAKLVRLLLRLRDQGNTILVIEHNLDVIRAADWIIDLGPGGGDRGGELVYEGPLAGLASCPRSATAPFLKPQEVPHGG